VTGAQTTLAVPHGYVVTSVFESDLYSYTLVAVGPDRRLAVIDVRDTTRSTVPRVTDLGAEPPSSYASRLRDGGPLGIYGGLWVPTDYGLLTAAGYPNPQTVGRSVPQTAPLTVVSLSAQGVDVRTVASPCRQGESPRNRVLAFGGGTALWCSSSADFSNELFLLS